MKLKDITTPKLTRIMQSYDDLNAVRVKKVYVVIQSIFHRAAEQGFIRESPCHNVILPKRKKSHKNKALEEDKLKRFLVLLDEKPWDEDFKRIVKVLIYTGMRSGECLGLSWEDVEFENRTISINHTLTKRLMSYLLGIKDFYKVVAIDKKAMTEFQTFNLRGELNHNGKKNKATFFVPVQTCPTR